MALFEDDSDMEDLAASPAAEQDTSARASPAAEQDTDARASPDAVQDTGFCALMPIRGSRGEHASLKGVRWLTT
jgi:hypothetical protein